MHLISDEEDLVSDDDIEALLNHAIKSAPIQGTEYGVRNLQHIVISTYYVF
jgi:hypothetical protein